MTRTRLPVSCLLLLALASGACAPRSDPLPPSDPGAPATAAPSSPAATDGHEASPEADGEASAFVALAVADLAARIGVPEADIRVTVVEPIDWPDAGLGCPLRDAEYAQVLTPGFHIALSAAGRTYDYHTSRSGFYVLCLDGAPMLPPVPGDIHDGQPWMPAGTPPGDPMAP